MPSASTIADATEIAGYLIVLGLVAWLVRRVFTYTIPRLAKDFRDTLEKQQELFAMVLTKQQDLFQKALDQQRTDFRESLAAERLDFKEIVHNRREEVAGRLNCIVEILSRKHS